MTMPGRFQQTTMVASHPRGLQRNGNATLLTPGPLPPIVMRQSQIPMRFRKCWRRAAAFPPHTFLIFSNFAFNLPQGLNRWYWIATSRSTSHSNLRAPMLFADDSECPIQTMAATGFAKSGIPLSCFRIRVCVRMRVGRNRDKCSSERNASSISTAHCALSNELVVTCLLASENPK